MANQETKVLTGKPLNPSAEWALDIALLVAGHNGGCLSAAVMDVLNAINRLNEAVAPLEDLQR